MYPTDTSLAVDYLLGRIDTIPVYSPLTRYWFYVRAVRTMNLPQYAISQIDQFLYAGGLNLAFDTDLDDLTDQEVSRLMKLVNQHLGKITERILVTGKVAVCIHLTPKDDGTLLPTLKVWDACNFEEKGGELHVFWKEGNKFMRIEYSPTEVRYFPPHTSPKRPPDPERVVKHTNGRMWAIISNSEDKPLFLEAHVELMFTLGLQVHFTAEHYGYFGSPLLSVPDVDEAETALRQRKRVIRSPEKEVHGPEILSMGGVDGSGWEEFKQGILKSFCQSLGISYVPDNHGAVTAPPLYLLNLATIRKAEAFRDVWESGLVDLIQVVWRVFEVNGLIGIPLPPHFSVERRCPYFPPNPQDDLAKLSVAQSLRDLGVDTAIALNHTIFPEMSVQEIRKLINGDPDYS